MSDMLVKLYDIRDDFVLENKLKEQGVRLFRILPPDSSRAIEFARSFGEGWANECLAACTNHPTTCFVAVKEKRIIGFACYDATARDFFGPTGVLKSERGQGIGMALLKKCLCAMYSEGYAYAIIGGVSGAEEFYRKTVGAVVIEGSSPGLYSTMLEFS